MRTVSAMSLFGRLRKQLSTGGLDVSIDAPDVINPDDESVTMHVTISSGQEPQQISNVCAQLLVQVTETTTSHHSGFSDDEYGHSDHTQRTTRQIILAEADLGATSIAAQDQMTFAVTLPLDALARREQRPELGDGRLANAAEGMLQWAAAHSGDRYQLRVTAQLDGMRDPSETVNVTVSGRSGGGYGFRRI